MKDTYEFSVKRLGKTCTCSCPCNEANPIDVTVEVSLKGKEREVIKINPQSVKKLS